MVKNIENRANSIEELDTDGATNANNEFTTSTNIDNNMNVLNTPIMEGSHVANMQNTEVDSCPIVCDRDVVSIEVIKAKIDVSNQMIACSHDLPLEGYDRIGSNPVFEESDGEQRFSIDDIANSEDQPCSSQGVEDEEGEVTKKNGEGLFIKVKRKRGRPIGKKKISPLPKRKPNRRSLPKCFNNFTDTKHNFT